MSNFKVGQKVVCVSSLERDEFDFEYGVFHPVKNEMYTIRRICEDASGIAFGLEEIINPILQYEDGIDEQLYYSHHFRPLDHQFAEDVIAMITELETVNI